MSIVVMPSYKLLSYIVVWFLEIFVDNYYGVRQTNWTITSNGVRSFKDVKDSEKDYLYVKKKSG